MSPTLPCVVNDLGDNLNSSLRLFAGVSVVYLLVKSTEDQKQLQSDLDKISTWCDNWQLTLNKDKCEVIHMTTKRNPLNFNYTINQSNP